MNKYKNFSIPTILIREQQKLNITNDEMLFIIKILSYGTDEVSYIEFAADFQGNREIIGTLKAKGIIKIVEKSDGIYIDITKIYDLIYTDSTKSNMVPENSGEVITADALDRISFLLNRQVKAFELDKIRDWISKGHNIEDIEVAIQKSVINNVDNFNYIDTVLQNGQQKNVENTVNVERNIEFY